jgi:hypothetical protein
MAVRDAYEGNGAGGANANGKGEVAETRMANFFNAAISGSPIRFDPYASPSHGIDHKARTVTPSRGGASP